MAYKNAEERKAYNKQYYQLNKEQINARSKAYNKQWYQLNKEQKTAYNQHYRENNREHYNTHRRGTFKFKMQSALSNILYTNQKTSKYTPYLGCTCDELRAHITQLCLQKGTTSIKTFRADGYTIDHIIPFAAFSHIENEQHSDCEWQRRVVSHYTNLQLLTLRENCEKGTSYTQKNYDLLVARVKCLRKLDECLSVF